MRFFRRRHRACQDCCHKRNRKTRRSQLTYGGGWRLEWRQDSGGEGPGTRQAGRLARGRGAGAGGPKQHPAPCDIPHTPNPKSGECTFCTCSPCKCIQRPSFDAVSPWQPAVDSWDLVCVLCARDVVTEMDVALHAISVNRHVHHVRARDAQRFWKVGLCQRRRTANEEQQACASAATASSTACRPQPARRRRACWA